MAFLWHWSEKSGILGAAGRSGSADFLCLAPDQYIRYGIGRRRLCVLNHVGIELPCCVRAGMTQHFGNSYHVNMVGDKGRCRTVTERMWIDVGEAMALAELL